MFPKMPVPNMTKIQVVGLVLFLVLVYPVLSIWRLVRGRDNVVHKGPNGPAR